MKLQFEVDQAEAFRQGVDAPNDIVSIKVDPASVPEADRNMIADRMYGTEIRSMEVSEFVFGDDEPKLRLGHFIVAKLPTFESLIEAVRNDEVEIQRKLVKLKAKSK